MTRIIEREMTITHADFFRLLPLAINGLEWHRNGNTVLIEDNHRTVCIVLEPEKIKEIGSLSLPITKIRIQCDGFTQEELRGFLQRFDLSYQRGGG